MSSFSINMRAIVLLCLLEAAFAKTYSWNGPGRGAPDINTGNACHADQESCGCCLMQQQLHRLKTHFNDTLTTLEKEYLETKQSLNIMETSRTAFSVGLFTDDRKCYGPYNFNTIIIYKHIFLNLGGNYNVETGIFTVPRSGVYIIAVSVYSDSGAPNANLAMCSSLQVNGRVVTGTRDLNSYDQEDSATIVVALQLNAEDEVAVSLPSGCFLCDDKNHYNTFSGFLLYVTE